MKLLPFVSKPEQEIQRIGNADTGYLYLVKRNGITPNENPVNFQAQQKKQQKFLLSLNKRIRQLAKENDVSIAEMRERVMGAQAPSNAQTAKTEDSNVEVVEEDEQKMFDYLDEPTAEMLFDMQEDKAKLAIRAATFMLEYRVLYPVHVKANAVPGSKQLTIESPQTEIPRNTSIKFDGRQYVEVIETLIPTFGDSETLDIDDLPFALKDGDVGFICEPGTRKLKVGFVNWCIEDTRSYLSEEMIALLFDFYQVESGAAVDINEDADEGNLLSPSKEPLNQTQPTGEESTTDSNGSE